MRRFFTALIRAQAAGYLAAVLGISLVVSVLLPYHELLRTTAVLFQMLIVVLVSIAWGTKPGLFAALLAVLALNYYFAPPLESLHLRELRYWPMITTFVVTVTAFAAPPLVGHFATQSRLRMEQAERTKAEIEKLYDKLQLNFERASQDEANRRSEPYIQLAQRIAKAGFFDWHIPSNTQFWSDSHNDVLGIDRSVKASYENWICAVHPDDRERMHEAVREFLISDKDYEQVDFRTITSDGDIRWINCRRGLLRNPGGSPVRMVGAVIDVTERRRNEDAARTGERFKSALLDCVTHDLLTPLTSIRVAATSLLQGQEMRATIGENERELLEVINEETERLNEYVGNLLAMARIDARELRLQQSAAQVNNIVAEALRRLRPESAQFKIQLCIPEDLPPVEVDSRAVVQVVHILMDNACKYGLDTPIWVSAHYEDSEIYVSVEDLGPGIPHELRERVFEKFYRIEEAFLKGEKRPARTAGSGMGLAIARGIVLAHGGRIWIEDAVSGSGTKVVFTLRIGQGKAGAADYEI